MKKVLFIGDVNVDIIMAGLASPVQVDREIFCTSFSVEMGSSAGIAAATYSYLANRPETVFFHGLAGQDEYGRFMVEGYASHGIDTRYIRCSDTVRTGVTVNLVHGRARSQVTYPGTIAAFGNLADTLSILGEFSHIHMAGVYLQDCFRPLVLDVLQAASRLGITTSLDPQWDASERWEHMSEWLPHLTWLFANEDEARSIAGVSNPEQACHRLANGCCCQPVIKLGKNGACTLEEGHFLQRPTVPAEPVDTIGAGDTLDAAFLFARLELGLFGAAALDFANAAAARSILFTGGYGAQSSYDDIMRFLESNGELQ